MFIYVTGFCRVQPSTYTSKCFLLFLTLFISGKLCCGYSSTSLLFLVVQSVCFVPVPLCILQWQHFAVSIVSVFAISVYVYKFLRKRFLYFEGFQNAIYLGTLKRDIDVIEPLMNYILLIYSMFLGSLIYFQQFVVVLKITLIAPNFYVY